MPARNAVVVLARILMAAYLQQEDCQIICQTGQAYWAQVEMATHCGTSRCLIPFFPAVTTLSHRQLLVALIPDPECEPSRCLRDYKSKKEIAPQATEVSQINATAMARLRPSRSRRCDR